MSFKPEVLFAVLLGVEKELSRAIKKHGFEKTPMSPTMDDGTRMIILMEEVGEFSHELTYDSDGDVGKAYAEAIQVAAMSVAIAYAKLMQLRSK